MKANKYDHQIVCTLEGVVAGTLVGGLIARNGGYFSGLSFLTIVGGGGVGYKLAPKEKE